MNPVSTLITLGGSKQPVWLKPEGTDLPKLKLLNSLTRRKVGGCEVIRTVSWCHKAGD